MQVICTTKRVRKDFKSKNFACKSDTFFLTDVFNIFRNMCLEI